MRAKAGSSSKLEGKKAELFVKNMLKSLSKVRGSDGTVDIQRSFWAIPFSTIPEVAMKKIDLEQYLQVAAQDVSLVEPLLI